MSNGSQFTLVEAEDGRNNNTTAATFSVMKREFWAARFFVLCSCLSD